MSRITRVIGFSVPPTLAEEVERIAREEQRTKSELFREMLRVYRAHRTGRREAAPETDSVRPRHHRISPPHT
jgi:metal-responsive CopG/Arc/MetJ family transcriptional regulator